MLFCMYVHMLHTGPPLPDVLLAWLRHQGRDLCVQHTLHACSHVGLAVFCLSTFCTLWEQLDTCCASAILSAHELLCSLNWQHNELLHFSWPVALALTFGGITAPTSVYMHVGYMLPVTWIFRQIPQLAITEFREGLRNFPESICTQSQTGHKPYCRTLSSKNGVVRMMGTCIWFLAICKRSTYSEGIYIRYSVLSFWTHRRKCETPTVGCVQHVCHASRCRTLYTCVYLMPHCRLYI